ncbi:response regulator [Hymenobacter lutimineralis]|uniref:Response regulator n=1 Tax=Hymenobacter lutimineralis TaxID=2606448 RepID=A0A5D6UTW2_9BACT|nr:MULTISPECIES: response regulator [Hymenobacter]QIX62296.1 response regulator [Hymenobacter sp. BT18]TYZ06923.1 response regulator [Hymenobacter lutimineralis]
MKTILLIEDNDFIRENTAEILEMAGYTVVAAENGKVGVEQALRTRPDLVVCDIMMPVLDGYGVLHIFNQNPQLQGVPFIFLTAKTERSDLRRGMELGADDYLTKPFEESELLSAISSRLARFSHLKPTYDLQANGLQEFLQDAQQTASLSSLTLDRKPHLVRRKQAVYREGDEPTRLYFVQAGRVKTTKTTAAGKELITGIYQAGEFFGYKALLEHSPHHDSAIAVEDATLLHIPGEDFMQLLLRNPEVSQQFIHLLAGNVREREEQLVDMAYNSLRKRVADALLRLHEQASTSAPEQPLIQLSRDDMAALIGTAPESLSRTLSEFRQDGIIELNNKFIRVLLPEKLRRANW